MSTRSTDDALASRTSADASCDASEACCDQTEECCGAEKDVVGSCSFSALGADALVSKATAGQTEKCCGAEKVDLGPCSSSPRSADAPASKVTPDALCAASTGCSGQTEKRCGTEEVDLGLCSSNTPCASNLYGCSGSSCCGDAPSAAPHREPSSLAVAKSSSVDVEKGTLVLEHVLLSVQGLTCAGCESKLSRSLASLPAVHNLQTSLVLSQAEFDLDESAITVDEVIRSVKRTAGFGCERVASKGQDLDVVVGDAADFVNRMKPAGTRSCDPPIYDVVRLDKQTVRVTYDAKMIGARDLLQTYFDPWARVAPPRAHSALGAGASHVRKTAYMTTLSAILTIPVLVLAWAPLVPRDIHYGAVSLALATIVQVVVAGPFYPSALRSLVFTGVIEMDLLIVLSTTTAYVFSVVSFAYEVAGRPLSTGSFFETSTLLVTLIMLGRLVSAVARQKAVESISVRSLQSTTALVMGPDGSEASEVDARLLQYGDVLKVAPESCLPTDGTVLSGASEVDESLVTGESRPVEKRAGSSVIAGSVNGSGALIVRLTRLPGENTISEIAGMVDAAKFSKPKVQELADRVAGYFVPIVLALTIVTFSIWVGVGMAVREQSGASAVVQAITYAVSVLIVSCPCAIGLAVPMVVVIAGGVAATRGVVFKSGQTIEVARKVKHVVFDKTGTLTKGRLCVVAELYLGSKEASAALVLGLTSGIKHPVSAAVAGHLVAQDIPPVGLEDVRTVTGSGVEGRRGGKTVRAGNCRWLGVEDLAPVKSLLSRGLTVFCAVHGDDLVALYGLEDTLRPDASAVVSELGRRGIAVSMVSGDDAGPVSSTAATLGLPAARVRSRCSPADKQRYVEDIMGREGEVVMFCGDGTNDAVALAQAGIGVHMNEGTDVAHSAADVVLIRPFLRGVLVLIDVSRASYHRIVFNFAWAFVYNSLAILLAAGAFVNARVPPQYAGLGEIVSVLPVILIALQLRWARMASDSIG
ncbi:MAG: hypothetical protein M1832_002909 [Thelocarpon impressellum]|nr:MAG: hypothetical protein M1832_002909 [Thelocarpon impressellum]